MPEVRLALLEKWKESIDARLWGDGGTVAYERSIEGRLSAVESTLRNADSLAEAARELRRSQARTWSKWEKLGLFVFAGTTAACAIVAALSSLLN